MDQNRIKRNQIRVRSLWNHAEVEGMIIYILRFSSLKI